MNRNVNPCKSALTAWFFAMFVTLLPAAAAPAARPATPEAAARTATPTVVTQAVTRSGFVLPANPKEGRDPFFPTSTRPYEAAAAGMPGGDLSLLVLRGISGPPEHRLVIINNHTFGVGDEGDVLTTRSRIHIRCVEIKDKSVVVESGGQRHELTNISTP